jgi:hypothetical protein
MNNARGTARTNAPMLGTWTLALFTVSLVLPTILSGMLLLHPGHAAAEPTTSSPTASPALATPAHWGLAVRTLAKDPAALETAMGHPFSSQGLYVSLTGSRYPTNPVIAMKNAGAQVYLNINSWHINSSGTKVCYPWANVASGTYDGYLQAWVDQLKSFDYPNTIITFHHEPSVTGNPTQPHCGTAADYVAAYNHVHAYFRGHGITYPFVWTMMASTFTQGTATAYEPKNYDIVGTDGFNLPSRQSGAWRTAAQIFSGAATFADHRGKPLLIGEIGTVEDPADSLHKAHWYSDAINTFTGFGNVVGIEWTDRLGYEPTSSSKSLAAWVDASRTLGFE